MRFADYPQLFIGNPSAMLRNRKQVSTDLFRHNKAKRLFAEGYTETQIQNYLGEKDLKNALAYINSEIYIP